MKVRIDCYIGKESNYFDTSFLERRKTWLPNMGIYLEFVLKGVYDKKVDFKVTSKGDGVLIARHSWNRFFLNIQKTETVDLELLVEDQSTIQKSISFDVVSIDVPLLFSVPFLLAYPVSDVRFFANRLSENLVNGTRFTLFYPSHLEELAKQEYQIEKGIHWKFFELMFSILTERGLVIYISPFDRQVAYSLSLIKKLREVLFDFMERGKKFRIVWDLSSGLRQKELGSLIDAVVSRFGREISIAVSENVYDKIGGEGFCYDFRGFKQKSLIPKNEKGVKIASLMSKEVVDFYGLRFFVHTAAEAAWGTEYVYPNPGRNLHKLHYSLSRALYQGYCDAKKET